VALFDRRARQVVAVLPTGRAPEGLALDAQGIRLYVALSGEDQVQVLDVSSGRELRRLNLRPGDEPRELGLSPDGRTLVVVNRGSASVSFFDPSSEMEVARVPVGDEPGPLLLDRTGQRAFVVNQGSATITLLDLGNRSVAGTIPTDPWPIRAALNRSGTRLYVVHGSSPYLLVLSLPDLRVVNRMLVGMGAGGLKVDPRTDLVYVSSRDLGRLQIFDPLSLMPVSQIDVPGPVSQMAIDDVENVLFGLMPDRRSALALDLATGRLLAVLEVPGRPYQVVLSGERR
jgi:YVTN family beta-propeller protein